MNTEYLKKMAAEILLVEKQKTAIDLAAKMLASAQEKNELIHVFGTDCVASAVVSNIFFRKGSLTNINPVFDPTLDPAHGAWRNVMCMELDGLAPCILDYYEYINPGETMVLITSENDAVMFNQALSWAKEKSLKTIVIADSKCDCDADVLIRCNTEMSVLSAVLKSLNDASVNLLQDKENSVWKGELDSDKGKINDLLTRIRHL